MVIRGVVGVLLVLLLGYGIIKGLPLIMGPSLEISSPEEFSSAPDGFVSLSGVDHYTETLYLNGETLLIDQEGAFQKELLLPSGGGILVLTATDRFGRSVTKERTVYVP